MGLEIIAGGSVESTRVGQKMTMTLVAEWVLYNNKILIGKDTSD